MDNFIFQADFVVYDCEVYFKMPIILERLFLATGRALLDMEKGELKFRLIDEKVTFNVRRTTKQPTDMRVVVVINNVDELESQPFG